MARPKLPTLPMPRAGAGESRVLPPSTVVLEGVEGWAEGIDERVMLGLGI